MSLAHLAPDYVRAIAPYQPGRPIADVARELGMNEADIIKLASNENPLGASPKAIAAAAAALNSTALYPEGAHELKAAISAKHGLPAEQIVLGNGSNDILELVARTFLHPGASAVFSQYSFAVYPLATQAVGARGIVVPAKDYGNDLDAMLKAIDASTKVVFIANPNNPTGTFVPGPKLHAFIAAVPKNVLVVLDEAYSEYLSDADAYNTTLWLTEFPNLIISHTLSKAYGLAGLRIGFGLGSAELMGLINRLRQPFNVNHLAMVAATAALADDDFIIESRRVNNEGMRWLEAAFNTRGIGFIPSHANFITFKMPRAADVFQHLLKQGVIVRPVAGYGMPEYLRVTIGTAAQNERFLAALDKARADLKV